MGSKMLGSAAMSDVPVSIIPYKVPEVIEDPPIVI
jgi:hypothetical protein